MPTPKRIRGSLQSDCDNFFFIVKTKLAKAGKIKVNVSGDADPIWVDIKSKADWDWLLQSVFRQQREQFKVWHVLMNNSDWTAFEIRKEA